MPGASRNRYEFMTAGEVGLVGAIIRLAIWDIQNGSPDLAADAWRYFAGPDYTLHLQMLGQPIDMLPREVIN